MNTERVMLDPGELVGLDGAPLEVDRFTQELSRLSLKNGDVLVVRMKEAKEDVKPLVTYLRYWLRNNDLPRVRLLGVVGDVSIEALSPEQMKSFGWVRA